MGLDMYLNPHLPSHHLSMGGAAVKNPPDLLPGTLDLLVLRTLTRGPLHGYGIARRVKEL